MDIPTINVAGFVMQLAKDAGLETSRDLYSGVADIYSTLSDKEVESDQTQELIIMLSRKKVISSQEAMMLYQAYLKEPGNDGENIDAVSVVGNGYNSHSITDDDRILSRKMTAIRTAKKN